MYYLYCVTFPDGKRYIGYTSQPARRLIDHSKPSRNHGTGKPTFSVLCVGNRSYIADLEGKAITAFQTNDPAIGYNDSIGRALSKAHKLKQSRAMMGKPAWNKGVKTGISWNRGVKRTDEDRAAIKAGLDQSEKTVGARKKLAELNKSRAGIPLTAEARAKIGAIHEGIPKSPEQRAKMAEARRLWWERKKAGMIIL